MTGIKFRVWPKPRRPHPIFPLIHQKRKTWPNRQFKTGVVRLRVERTPRDGGLEISSS